MSCSMIFWTPASGQAYKKEGLGVRFDTVFLHVLWQRAVCIAIKRDEPRLPTSPEVTNQRFLPALLEFSHQLRILRHLPYIFPIFLVRKAGYAEDSVQLFAMVRVRRLHVLLFAMKNWFWLNKKHNKTFCATHLIINTNRQELSENASNGPDV